MSPVPVWDMARKKRRMVEATAKLGGKCARCGSLGPLDFDHIDHTSRNFKISDARQVGEATFWAEVAKCQLLCRPCHTEKGFEEGTVPRPKHGTYTGYKDRGCRCEPCRQAARVAERRRRANRAARLATQKAPPPAVIRELDPKKLR